MQEEIQDISVFAPNGALIVAACEQILADQEVDTLGWWIDENGHLRLNWGEGSVSEGGDGADAPATQNGLRLYRCGAGEFWREDQLVVYHVNEKNEPIGDPVPFKAEWIDPVGDTGLLEAARSIAAAGEDALVALENADSEALRAAKMKELGSLAKAVKILREIVGPRREADANGPVAVAA